MATLASRIEDYLEKLYEDSEIVVNDGDCDLVAMHIANDVKGITDPGQIREAVKQSCYREAESGMLGNPEIHPDIANIVLNP